MKILIFLLPLAGFLLILIGVAFVWAVRSKQFEDLEGPAYRILFDENDGPFHEGTEKHQPRSNSENK